MYCNKTNQSTINVRLTFKRKELVYDAENYSFVEGDIMGADEQHAKHQVIDIGQEGNIDRVTRVLDLVHAECVEMLYPYTKTEIPTNTKGLDDILTERQEYYIDLVLPKAFSMTTINLLEKLIHEYMVSRVLADWMSITHPSSQANWELKCALIKEKIQSSLFARIGKVRRRCKPF
jgi:hypothetical protein